MKPLNEKEAFSKEILQDSYRHGVILMIDQQINIIQTLMEKHKDLVRSPLNYNVCCGIIDQLKMHSTSAFSHSSEEKLTDQVDISPYL